VKKDNLAVIILSAGYSSRMHRFKPFLKFGKYTAIEKLINTYKSSGIEEIIVVVGHRGQEVIEKVQDNKVRFIYNKDYPKGMYSSVLAGVNSLSPHIQGFFISPVDIPIIKNHSIDYIKKEYLNSTKGIIHPSFCGKRGHPPLIDNKYIDLILNNHGEGGLKRLLQKYEEDALDIALADESILMDMDTEADYIRLLEYYHMKAPSSGECGELFNIYNVPDNIKRHCIKVADLALELLDNHQTNTGHINRKVLKAAGLLHDIVRKERNHAQRGADILSKMGYDEVAHIISTHMDIRVDENQDITPNEILYLADKLVKEDRIVPLKIRMEETMELYGGNKEAMDNIQNRYKMAEKIMKKLKINNGKMPIYE